MKIRSLFYHIKDGLKNIYRNRLFSLASIATIAACIFLFGILYSLVMNFQYMVKKAENEVCVTVFFDEGLSETQIKQLGDTISKRVEVSSVHYTSAEEAWDKFKTEYFKEYPELALGFKNDNPLANSAQARPDNRRVRLHGAAGAHGGEDKNVLPRGRPRVRAA